MIYTLEGTVHEVGNLKEGITNEREWQLRSFVLETTREWNEKTYSDFVEFTAFGKAVDGLADVNVGDKAEASFTISSRQKESQDGRKYWSTTAKCISLRIANSATVAPAPKEEKHDFDTSNHPDDLPF